eukprot:TRINITY_DN49341_c0_g1_i1.p1 TRINITY_DN49341_c0_g1~~TRINITY_DN49341_c0_g1_i1.p1  ORF type:complete len:667 (+),score=132.19 TRINITY_DN49341_c0_g1_i1:138-2138(+)
MESAAAAAAAAAAALGLPFGSGDQTERHSAIATTSRQVYHSEDSISDLRLRVRLAPRGQGDASHVETAEFAWQERVLGRHEVAQQGAIPDVGGAHPRVGPYLFTRLLQGEATADEATWEDEEEDWVAADAAQAYEDDYYDAEAEAETEGFLTSCFRRCWRAVIRCRCRCRRRRGRRRGVDGPRHMRVARELTARAFSETGLEPYDSCERMQVLVVLDFNGLAYAQPPADPATAAAQPLPPIGEHRCEVVLFELVVRHGGRVLEARPPFRGAAADGSLPYRFQALDRWYAYSVENASKEPAPEDRLAALEARRDFEASAATLRGSLAGSGFDAVSRDAVAQYSVFGEIVAFEPDAEDGSELRDPDDAFVEAAASPSMAKAPTLPQSRGHDASDPEAHLWQRLGVEAMFRCTRPVPLHASFWRPSFRAQCELSLPVGGEWRAAVAANDDVEPAAVGVARVLGACQPIRTQFASPSGCYTHRKQCIFNQPIELHLDELVSNGGDVDAHGLPHDPVPPRFILEVHRADTWERQSLHGYAFVDIPRQPGSHDLRAQLWAPTGTITQQLNSKFCGTYLPLASPHLVATADPRRCNTLPRNRSALRTHTAAGVLRLRLHVVRQRRMTLYRPPSARDLARSRALEAAGLSGDPVSGLRRRRRRQQRAELASSGG